MTTARTPVAISSSAAIRSMLAWSMTAMSPGARRLTRSFVLRPEPGGALDRRRARAAAVAARQQRCEADGDSRWPIAETTRPCGVPRLAPQAAASSSRAWRLGGLVAGVGAEHAADLGDQLVAVDALDRRASGSPPAAPSRSRKWVAASEATCGRWVMQITWRPSPSARSRSPTARAVLPPIPASISSKTSVAAPPRRPEPA